MASAAGGDFYFRYYVGHQGRFGHEFLEFEFRPDGKMRYANNSNYKHDSLIKKEAHVSGAVLREVQRMVTESGVLEKDDAQWPEPDRIGRQELEVVCGAEHVSFATAKIGSLLDVEQCRDPEGLRAFYYLVQDVKSLVMSLISLHFKAVSGASSAPIKWVRFAPCTRGDSREAMAYAVAGGAKAGVRVSKRQTTRRGVPRAAALPKRSPEAAAPPPAAKPASRARLAAESAALSLLAAAPALAEGEVSDETAFVYLLGLAGVIVTATITLVLGSNLFIKNIV